VLLLFHICGSKPASTFQLEVVCQICLLFSKVLLCMQCSSNFQEKCERLLLIKQNGNYYGISDRREYVRGMLWCDKTNQKIPTEALMSKVRERKFVKILCILDKLASLHSQIAWMEDRRCGWILARAVKLLNSKCKEGCVETSWWTSNHGKQGQKLWPWDAAGGHCGGMGVGGGGCQENHWGTAAGRGGVWGCKLWVATRLGGRDKGQGAAAVLGRLRRQVRRQQTGRELQSHWKAAAAQVAAQVAAQLAFFKPPLRLWHYSGSEGRAWANSTSRLFELAELQWREETSSSVSCL
jgi:hypothetical protein